MDTAWKHPGQGTRPYLFSCAPDEPLRPFGACRTDGKVPTKDDYP